MSPGFREFPFPPIFPRQLSGKKVLRLAHAHTHTHPTHTTRTCKHTLDIYTQHEHANTHWTFTNTHPHAHAHTGHLHTRTPTHTHTLDIYTQHEHGNTVKVYWSYGNLETNPAVLSGVLRNYFISSLAPASMFLFLFWLRLSSISSHIHTYCHLKIYFNSSNIRNR